ncbi:MAG TPA: ribonuclease HII [Tissierellaceae bacterium]|nr:ribonuclease HII [Tissierellaceae bacterium]
MLKLENKIYESGYNKIACIDEVGRGCLAGDVLACAIVMPRGLQIDGVKDSKKLSQKKREFLYDKIIENCIAYGIGRVSPKVIDKINIKESTRLAMKFAVQNLKDHKENLVLPDYLLIDAEEIDLNIHYDSIIKGDEKSHGIGCASIVAKVYRDRLCFEWDKKYNGYNLKKHKGYGTKEHREYIKNLGPSEIHRMSFLKKILNS